MIEMLQRWVRWDHNYTRSNFNYVWTLSGVLVILTLDCVSVFWITLSSQSSMSIDVVCVCKRKAQLKCIQLFSHAVSLPQLLICISMKGTHDSGLVCKLLDSPKIFLITFVRINHWQTLWTVIMTLMLLFLDDINAALNSVITMEYFVKMTITNFDNTTEKINK